MKTFSCVFRSSAIILIAALISISIPAHTDAQILGLLTLERLSILDTHRTGARPMGMGGAYTAISDDAMALLYNPAGLTQIEDREISFGIHHRQVDITSIYDGERAPGNNSYTSFGHLALIQPYTSYEGNIVFGVGVFRVGGSDLEYTRIASRTDLGGTIENAFNQSGSIYQFRFGCGIDLTDRLSVGANLVLWNESVSFTETIEFEETGSDSSYLYIDDAKTDLDGISLEFGLLMALTSNVRAGITLSTPAKLYYDGDGYDDYSGTYPDGWPWETEEDYYFIDDEFTLPMKFTGGLAVEINQLILAADVTYSDYSQTRYNDLKIINENEPQRDILEASFSYNMGGEFTVPGTTLSLRAGYSYIPLRLQGMDEISYIIDTPSVWGIATDYEFYEMADDRQFITFGVGGIVDDVLALDLGVTHAKFERKTPFLSEEKSITEVVVTGAYRF